MHPEVNVSVEQRRRWREDEKLSILGKVGLNGAEVEKLNVDAFDQSSLCNNASQLPVTAAGT